ncbi:MAG TPA: hypothetical protein VKD72_05570 [Gemmataceae bacterium]|nr:hypothetical protein [Gemmataceae bacterium]
MSHLNRFRRWHPTPASNRTSSRPPRQPRARNLGPGRGKDPSRRLPVLPWGRFVRETAGYFVMTFGGLGAVLCVVLGLGVSVGPLLRGTLGLDGVLGLTLLGLTGVSAGGLLLCYVGQALARR